MSEGTPKEFFEVQLGAFTGPLDLLCHLIESREIDAAKIKLTDLISQYVHFALMTKRATLPELADFFAMASRLLLGKVRALFPSTPRDEEPDEEDLPYDFEGEEEALRGALERFRPYRRAVIWMRQQQEQRERSFMRIIEGEGPPWYDIGDLYGLARLWWSTIEEYNQKRRRGTDEDYFMEEIPDAVPEEVLVEQRMEDIMNRLENGTGTGLRELMRLFPVGSLIVTLLALLELSRMGKIHLSQEEVWGEVQVLAS